MKKFLVIAASVALAILATFVFAPAPATAGDLDDLTALGDEGGGDKPAATGRKTGGGGGPSKAVKALEERLKALEEKEAKAPKPGVVTEESITSYFIPIYIGAGIAVVLLVPVLIYLVGFKVRFSGLADKVDKVDKKADGLGGAISALKKEVNNKVDKTPSTPPPPAPGPK